MLHAEGGWSLGKGPGPEPVQDASGFRLVSPLGQRKLSLLVQSDSRKNVRVVCSDTIVRERQALVEQVKESRQQWSDCCDGKDKAGAQEAAWWLDQRKRAMRGMEMDVLWNGDIVLAHQTQLNRKIGARAGKA